LSHQLLLNKPHHTAKGELPLFGVIKEMRNSVRQSMITEIAILKIKDQQNNEFETSFAKAEKIISRMKGYIKHELLKCMEADNQYLLIVRWETLEDHTIGFRESEEYLKWKKLLHHFYDPFPTVEHYSEVKFASNSD